MLEDFHEGGGFEGVLQIFPEIRTTRYRTNLFGNIEIIFCDEFVDVEAYIFFLVVPTLFLLFLFGFECIAGSKALNVFVAVDFGEALAHFCVSVFEAAVGVGDGGDDGVFGGAADG